MSSPIDPAPLFVRTLQMVCGSLVVGVLVFAAIAATVPMSGGPVTAPTSQLRLILIAMLLVLTPLALILRRLLLGVPNREVDRPGALTGESDVEIDASSLQGRFSAATIVSCAMMEAVGLFAVVVFLIGRDPIDLVLALWPVLLILLVLFPTSGRWAGFVRSVREAGPC